MAPVRFVVLTLVALLSTLVVAVPAVDSQTAPAPAVASATVALPGNDFAFVGAINAQRQAHGLPALTMLGSMQQAARWWTDELVRGSYLAHAPNIATGLPSNWRRAGENAGRGATVQSLMAAFMASPSHRANILDPDFTHIGVATVQGTDGRIYTVHRFASFS